MTLLMVPGNVDEGYVQHMDIIYRTIDKKGAHIPSHGGELHPLSQLFSCCPQAGQAKDA